MSVHPTVWGVLIVGGIIAFLAIIHQRELREGQFLALLVFLAAGSIFPPAAIGIGLVIIVSMLLRGAGVDAASWLAATAGRATAPSTPGLPLGPPSQPVQIPAGYNPFPAPITNVYNYNPATQGANA